HHPGTRVGTVREGSTCGSEGSLMVFDPGVGSGLAAGAAAGVAIGASMSAFAKTAAAGGFAVNETGGQALLTAIRNMKDRIDEIRADTMVGTFQPKLGLTHGAEVMANVDLAVAQDDQGFMPMLLKFRESLESAEQGINDAMRNYVAMDQSGAARYLST
ncbi:hypothetical protein, partial [Actinophytocola sp.]|uniref:hypothetical protein n=1 Tax=Actinophytocola sp. TaxID=1872138 RepID=UPI002D7E1E64